jgi:hypothetical protein
MEDFGFGHPAHPGAVHAHIRHQTPLDHPNTDVPSIDRYLCNCTLCAI